MNVVLYARVSSDDQAERDTIADQVHLYEKWVDLHGHTDVGRYLDDGVTGTLAMHERPEGARLLSALVTGQIEAVAFRSVSRLGRRTRVVLDTVDRADAAKVSLISITEPFDTSSPIGRFVVTILASISELDRENILAQTRAGMRRRAREGGWLGGKCAYGYRIEGRRHLAHLVLDDTESGQGGTRAELARLIFERVASGTSCDLLAQQLTAQGIPAWGGGAWSAAVISRMIHNPVYRGEHQHGDAIEGSILPVSLSPAPRIVSDLLWRTANEQVERNRRLSGKSAKRLYLLRGLVVCGGCGCAYSGQTIDAARADATDHHEGVLYRCNGRASGRTDPTTGERCTSPYLPGRIESDVWQIVAATLADPKVIARAVEARQETTTAPHEDTTRLLRAIAEREEQRGRVVALYRRGRIDESELDRQLDELGAEVLTLRSEIARLEMEAQSAHLAQEQARIAGLSLAALADRVAGRIDKLDREEKHAILTELIQRIEVEAGTPTPRNKHPKPAVRIQFRFTASPPETDADCSGNTYHEGQINLIQQMVSEWGLPELQAALLAKG